MEDHERANSSDTRGNRQYSFAYRDLREEFQRWIFEKRPSGKKGDSTTNVIFISI